MILTRDNFAELLTPIHRQIFYDEILDMEPQYEKVSDSDEMRKAVETYQHVSGFGLWEKNTEGNQINTDTSKQGFTATLEAERSDKGYDVTWELIRDDLYNVIGGQGSGGSASKLGKGLHQSIEKEIADQYTGGFTNVGYDGVSTFNAAHTLANATQTNSNLATGALTPANLKLALTLARDTRDEANLKEMVRANQLIVGQNLEWTANEVLNSGRQALEFSNTANVLPNMEICVLDYIDDDSTYPNMWAVRDNRLKSLVQAWRDRPYYDSMQLQRTTDYFFYGVARWVNSFVNYRGVVASNGT